MESKAERLVNDFAEFVNSFNFDADEFAKNVMKEHRTLQQSMFQVMIVTMREWAKNYESGRYDLRNEDTVKLCYEIVKEFDDKMFTRFI